MTDEYFFIKMVKPFWVYVKKLLCAYHKELLNFQM